MADRTRPRTSKDRSATLWLPGRREGGVRWRWCLVSGFQNQKNCESPTRPQKLKLNPGSSRQMASELGRLIWKNWPSGWKYGIIWYVQIKWLCLGIIWIDLIDSYLFIYLYLYLFFDHSHRLYHGAWHAVGPAQVPQWFWTIVAQAYRLICRLNIIQTCVYSISHYSRYIFSVKEIKIHK